MKALIGTGGILAVQGVSQVPADGVPILEIGKFLIQVAIGVATIWKMFKKPKAEETTEVKKEVEQLNEIENVKKHQN